LTKRLAWFRSRRADRVGRETIHSRSTPGLDPERTTTPVIPDATFAAMLAKIAKEFEAQPKKGRKSGRRGRPPAHIDPLDDDMPETTDTLLEELR
jgi:hypothetical protein